MNMGITIRRLTNVFIALLLLISLVAAYVQISDQAFLNGPRLASGDYNAIGRCPPYDAPIRGTIYDRNGVKLAWSVPDPNAFCGYKRVYADPTLAPLIGYFSYTYGTAGLEATYDDQLSGLQHGVTIQNVAQKLLHRPQYGEDIYLTIDERLQQYANQVYDTEALHYSGFCQPNGTNPPGGLIVENPNNGEILAMVSRPYYDPNRVAAGDTQYFQSLQADPNAPLTNHTTQITYVPGSGFKTLTLMAALDTGAISLDKQYDENTALYYTVNGEHINWIDKINGQWPGLQFPITLQDAFAYSDNSVFAREAVGVGANQWLNYARKFGIGTPGQGMPNVQAIPFDGPQTQSTAFSANTNGKPTQFTDNLLAESGFGQGQLQITLLTMSEMTSAVAAGGLLYEPHVGYKIVPHGTSANDILPTAPTLYGGGPVIRPETATAIRKAMWAVSSYGTANTVTDPNTGQHLSQTGVFQGGKTGTGETGIGATANDTGGKIQGWWNSLAPDDQAPGGGSAKYVIAITKEDVSRQYDNDGACQVFVADHTYQYAMQHNVGY